MPYLPIAATVGEGGSITAPGEKLFRPGDISQKYTVTANVGYTIYYIQVDGKAVPNSVNCGDTAFFTFDAIYGPRTINDVFKKAAHLFTPAGGEPSGWYFTPINCYLPALLHFYCHCH